MMMYSTDAVLGTYATPRLTNLKLWKEPTLVLTPSLSTASPLWCMFNGSAYRSTVNSNSELQNDDSRCITGLCTGRMGMKLTIVDMIDMRLNEESDVTT